METVCLADVCFVFTASDTAELKSGGNARYAALKEPKVLMPVLMVMMTVMMTVMTTMSCLLL